MTNPLYLVELTAAIDAAGTTQTFYFGSHGFVTEPTDTPANTVYLPRLKRSASAVRQMFSGTRTFGQSRVGFGEIVIGNLDGELDDLVSYSFDNRAVVLRAGQVGDAFSDLTVVLRATAKQVQFSNREIVVSLKDRLAELDKPHLSTVYAGSNSLPAGVEGLDDLKGKYKPRVYGKVFNIPAPCVNTSRNIYQVSDSAISTVDTVYKSGVALTRENPDYTSQADMESNTPSSAAYYRVWPAGGMFRLGTTPTGLVTADVTAGAAAGNRTVAQVLQSMAINAGISSGDISSADVTALDTAQTAVVGLWVNDGSTTLQIMDRMANGLGVYYQFDATGDLRMGQLAAPSGTAVATIRQWNTQSLERVMTGDGLPTWRVQLKHSRYETTQTAGIDAVSADRRSDVAQQYRTVVAEDAAIKTQWLAAQTLERESLLTSASDAATEAARVLALYKVQRHVYLARGVQLSATQIRSIDLNSVVSVEWDRFGLDAGVLMRVISISADYVRNVADITLWH